MITTQIIWRCSCGTKGTIPLGTERKDLDQLRFVRATHNEGRGCELMSEVKRVESSVGSQRQNPSPEA